MIESPLKLELEASVRERVEMALVRRLDDALHGNVERNKRLKDFDALVEGREMDKLPIPYDDSCQLIDPLVWEQRTQLLANVAQPIKRDPLVLTKGKRPDLDQAARIQEAWLADVWNAEGFKPVFYDYLSNACRDDYGVIYSGWVERKKRVREVFYWDGTYDSNEDMNLVTADKRLQPFDQYKAVPCMVPKDGGTGGEYRCVEEKDFFFYPANARSIERSVMTFERMDMSEGELLQGIEDYGFDEDSVLEILSLGPVRTNADEQRDEQNDAKGIDGQVSEIAEGEYECYLMFGTLPYLWKSDGDSDLPRELWHDQVTGMLCKTHNILFHLDFSPYADKPYEAQSLDPKSNDVNGSGIVEKLEPIAYEATHVVRTTMNAFDFEIQPCLVATAEDVAKNRSKKLKPGVMLEETTPNSLRPLVQTQKALAGFEVLGQINARGKSVAATQSYGSYDNKVRRVAEIQGAAAAADLKFDLYQYNLYQILPKLAARRVAYEMQFRPDAERIVQTAQGEHRVTAKELLGEFTYSVSQTSADSNPDARLQKEQSCLDIQRSYFELSERFPYRVVALYHSHRGALLNMDIRNPEEYLEDEPAPPPVLPPLEGMDGAIPPQGAAMPMPQGAM